MFFTLEDYKNIAEYLRLNSKKDTDFPTTLLVKEEDYIPIIQDAVNKKMTVENLRNNLSKGPKGDKGDPGKDADIWTIGADDFWYVNGEKTTFKSRGEDGKPPLLRVSADGQSIEISNDGGQTWLPFEKNFNKLRVLGYVDSVQLLPKNANIGDIYGVWNPDVYSGRVDEEGHLIKGAYDLYINTVKDWLLDYTITKVYDYDTELPSSATDGTAVLVPVTYLTLDKEKIDGYKVYRFSLEKDGWTMILNTAEIYANKEDIINYGDNVYALVQGTTAGTYELYKRSTGWVYFGTNASITYHLVQNINEGTATNVLSGKAVKDAVETETSAREQDVSDINQTIDNFKQEVKETYGDYTENPEFVYAKTDAEDKILWGIKTDGSIYYGAGVPPQIREYVDMKVKEMSPEGYGDIINFLDGIEFGDKKLQELLDEKVDKVEGKSLIDEEFANGIHYEENPEFVEVKLDGENKILEAIYKDGTKLLPAGYNVDGVIVKTLSNPEFLAVWLDNANHILFALEKDGNVMFATGVPRQIIEYVEEIIKPFEELFHLEENPEYVDVKLDAENKITEATKTDGTKVFPAGAEFDGNIVKGLDNPEYLELTTDAEEKIINSIDVELEDIRYGGINLSEMKRDADCDVLECGFDEDRDDIYTIENNDSTITMEVDDDLNVYEVKDSRHTAKIVMEENGEVYLEQTIKEI